MTREFYFKLLLETDSRVFVES